MTPASLLSRPSSPRGRAPCPLHGGSRASLAWRPRTNRPGWLLHCFTCGFSGDLADFYAALHGVTLAEALRITSTELAAGLPPWEPTAQPVDALEVLCVRCGSTERFLGRAYRTPGRSGADWTSTPALEARCSSWELASGEDWGVCPTCIDGPPPTREELLLSVRIATLPCGYDPADFVQGRPPSKACDLHEPPCR